MQKRVGFAGLGLMGSRMAENLLKKGFPLTVWNRTPARVDLAVIRSDLAQLHQRQSGVLDAGRPDVVAELAEHRGGPHSNASEMPAARP